MRTLDAYLREYAASHSHVANQVIHMICVPIIFFTSTGLLWSVPLDPLVPGAFDSRGGFNLATLAALPVAAFYARLGGRTLLTGFTWMFVAGLGSFVLQSVGAPLAGLCLALWLVAWVVQIYGHKIEGAKPSFFDDLVFLLIGPLFVHDKLVRLLAAGSIRGSARG